MSYPKEKIDLLTALVKQKNPEIILRGEVDGDMEEYVFWAFAQLRAQGSPAVQITIDSHGGNSNRGHDIYDVIKNYTGETIATVYSRAHSAASMILQACTKRRMAFHAEIIIHNPLKSMVSLDEITFPSRFKKLKETLRSYQAKLVRVYMLRSKQDKKSIIAQLAKDSPLSSAESLEFGLIDEIVGED